MHGELEPGRIGSVQDLLALHSVSDPYGDGVLGQARNDMFEDGPRVFLGLDQPRQVNGEGDAELACVPLQLRDVQESGG